MYLFCDFNLFHIGNGWANAVVVVCMFVFEHYTAYRTAPGLNEHIELRKVREQDQVKFYYHNRTIKSTKRK